MSEKDFDDVIDFLKEMEDDNTIPKNVKSKIHNVISILKGDEEVRVVVNKALHELDDVSDDINMQAYTRTQIWNVVSLLEKFNV